MRLAVEHEDIIEQLNPGFSTIDAEKINIITPFKGAPDTQFHIGFSLPLAHLANAAQFIIDIGCNNKRVFIGLGILLTMNADVSIDNHIITIVMWIDIGFWHYIHQAGILEAVTNTDGIDARETFAHAHHAVVAEIGIEASASNNYIDNYVSNMNTQAGNLRSCIVAFDRDNARYGNYGSYQTSVDMIHKNWGYAWSRGFFEGILVYPVAWLVDAFTNVFGGIKSNAIPQLLALVVVTIIVRLFIFAATFPSTIQKHKMKAIQTELAKIQAKYPNSNTSQVERQRMAKEQQALYKKHKVHPFLQLLVMVIQFPVFICVWGAFTGSAVLSTGEFLGLHLSSSIMSVLINFSGWPGNGGWWTALVLFLLMAGAQFLSMKLPQWIQKAKNKKIAKLGVNPAQNQQNKTMTIVSYVMLAVIIFMGFSLPAAMGVYWFVGALVSLAQSFITMAIASAMLKRQKHKK